MTDYIQVMTTVARRDEADQIASTLVDERLAACVQVLGPIASTYRWQGNIETSQEWLCLIKSRSDLFPEIERAIRAVHLYEIPEIIALPMVSGSEAYLAWLEREVKAKAQ